MEKKALTALQRGIQLYREVPQRCIPPIALTFFRKRIDECNDGSSVDDIYIRSFAIFAQVVEGLECADREYAASPSDIKWFQEEYRDTPEALKGCEPLPPLPAQTVKVRRSCPSLVEKGNSQ